MRARVRNKPLVRGVLAELDRAEEPDVAVRADRTVLLREPLHVAVHDIAHARAALDEAFVDDHVDRGQRARKAHRVRVVGEPAGEDVLAEVVRDPIAERHHAEREVARRQALRHRADVGHDVAVLEREELARARPAAHDFVAHEEDAVLLEQRLEALEVALRRRKDAVRARDRLDEHRGDVLRALVLDDFLEVAQVVGGDLLVGVAEAELIRPRVHHAHHAGHAGFGRPAARIAGERDRAVGRAVVAAVADEDLVAAGEQARGLDRVLVGFGAAERVEEGVEVAGHEFGKAQREARADLGRHAGVGVGERRGLVLDRLDDLRVRMPDVDAHELAVEVDPALALGTVEVDALGARDGNRVDLRGGAPREEAVLHARVDHLARGHGGGGGAAHGELRSVHGTCRAVPGTAWHMPCTRTAPLSCGGHSGRGPLDLCARHVPCSARHCMACAVHVSSSRFGRAGAPTCS